MGCAVSAPVAEKKPWGLTAALRDSEPIPEVPEEYAREIATTLAESKDRGVTVDATDMFEGDTSCVSSEDVLSAPPTQSHIARLRELEAFFEIDSSDQHVNTSRLLMYYIRMVEKDKARVRARSWTPLDGAPLTVPLASITERSASMNVGQDSYYEQTPTRSGSLRAARTQRVYSDPAASLPNLAPISPQHSFNIHRLNDAASASNLVNTAAPTVLEMADRPVMTSMLAHVETNPEGVRRMAQESQ